MTIALVNNSKIHNDLTLTIPKYIKKKFKKYEYIEQGKLKDESGFPVPTEQGIKRKALKKIHVPANSFVLLTTIDY